MPTNLVYNAHEEHWWNQAKDAAKKEGKEGDWGYVTAIFERIKHNASQSGTAFPGAFGVQSLEGGETMRETKEEYDKRRLDEQRWDEARRKAGEEGHRDDWKYIQAIYDRLLHHDDSRSAASGSQNTTMSVEQRLERAERFLAVLVADHVMSDTPNPSDRRKKGYPKNRSEYADPQDRAYPLNDKEHVDAAARYFGKYKDRYSKKKREEIKRRIDEAEKKYGIHSEHKSESAMSADTYHHAISEVLSIVKEAIEDEPDPDILSLMREMLNSEENPRTRAEMFDADAMIDDFMRDVRGWAGFGHS